MRPARSPSKPGSADAGTTRSFCMLITLREATKMTAFTWYGHPGGDWFHLALARSQGHGTVGPAAGVVSPYLSPYSGRPKRPMAVSIRPAVPAWNAWVAMLRIRYAVPQLWLEASACPTSCGVAWGRRVIASALPREHGARHQLVTRGSIKLRLVPLCLAGPSFVLPRLRARLLVMVSQSAGDSGADC